MINFIFNKVIKDEPWQIAATRFCVSKAQSGFTAKELIEHLKANYEIDDVQINQFFEEEIIQPVGRNVARSYRRNVNGSDALWTAPIIMLSNLNDYDALMEARKSSKFAVFIAVGSLIVTFIATILPFILANKIK